MSLDGLDELSKEGQNLFNASNSAEAKQNYKNWVEKISIWLSKKFPETGLTADWLSKEIPYENYSSPALEQSALQNNINTRLRWLGNLPSKVRLNNLLGPVRAQNDAHEIGRKEIKLQTTSRAYVDPERIEQLKILEQKKFDLTRLIRLCEEVNICFAGECYIALIMLVRAILDHVPPIFQKSTFAELANNYGDGGKSFKEAMLNLENSSRKIADHYLHSQIRSVEAVPNATQTDFSNNIDLLLSEIVRYLKSTSPSVN